MTYFKARGAALAAARGRLTPPSGQDEQYDVYIYHPPKGEDEQGHESWEKKRSTKNRLRAVVAAQKLRDTQQYRRVEIKRKSYDLRSARKVVRTFKVYEGGKNAAPDAVSGRTLVWGLMALAGLGAAALVLQ